MAAVYTVKKGDTLSEIAEANLSTIRTAAGDQSLTIYQATDKLKQWNNISNANYICIGDKILLGPPSSTSSSVKTSNRATITNFGLLAGTDRDMYAKWSWSMTPVDYYQVVWEYKTENGVWLTGNDSQIKIKESTYSAPANAISVRFKVKPFSTKKKSLGKETYYWEADWTTWKTYNFASNPPSDISAPTVTIDKFTLTAEVNNISSDANTTHVQFEIVKNDSVVFKKLTASVVTGKASVSCTIDAGGKYKVRCRGYSSKTKLYGEWSDYSGNAETIPTTPSGITAIRAESDAKVYIEWSKVGNATKYDIEYTTKKEYFDTSTETTIVTTQTAENKYYITGLEIGQRYFFRVRAVNDSGSSGWTGVKDVIVGKKPESPTTWSSTTTCSVGGSLIFYWVHNSADGSSQTYAEIEMYVNNVKQDIPPIKNTTDEELKDKTSSYVVDTSSYTEGAKIKWRVRTSGILKDENGNYIYSDWSIERTVDVYAPPTLAMNLTDSNGETVETLEHFPIYVNLESGPSVQTPTGYYLTITTNEGYETNGQNGVLKIVSSGEQIYSKYFNSTIYNPIYMLNPNDVDLANNVEYTIKCVVYMNSGLTADNEVIFTTGWTDDLSEPNAEISIDYESLSATICPYCVNVDDDLIEGVTLSVYRRCYDGELIEIAYGLDNTRSTHVTDPHPSLDYARYRIVAVDTNTGAVSFYDMPGHEIQEKAVIIQWAEEWSNFETYNDSPSSDAPDERTWSGSMLKLPYNIDVSDSNKPDVSVVSYIGRSHPVSYYGTQIGDTSTWNVEIPKSDIETLYSLRRLSRYMGDVYVREPSGSGYWANITVSFNQNHCEVTIPVTINITRVEGGI